MYRIYKSGAVELAGEAFQIKDQPRPTPPSVAQLAAAGQAAAPSGYDMGALDFDPQQAETLLQDTRQQAAQMIATSRQQALVETEKIRQEAFQEVANLRNQAYLEGQAQGYAEGAAAKVTAVEELVQKLEQAVATMEGRFEGFIAEYESNLKWAVAEVSGKVLGRILERDELELLQTVKDAVEQVRNAEWIDLHVCRDSVELIDRLQREFAPLKQLEVVPDDLPSGSVLLDIPSGKLDASVQAQLQTLREYFANHTLEL